jgi:5-methylcytosine-specific restriction endonuclease McrA
MVGLGVTREQIDYVSKIAEGSRRVRELRDDEGWPINSHVDEPGLSPSEYRLLSTDPRDRRDASQRLYPEQLRQRVFERDDYTCQVCGRNRKKALNAGDTRFYLEVHHMEAMADELANMMPAQRNRIGNLITLCHSDHLTETAKLQNAKRARRVTARGT